MCNQKVPKGTQILNSLSCVVIDGVEALVDLVIVGNPLRSAPGVDNFRNGTDPNSKKDGKFISHQSSSLEVSGGMWTALL